MKIVDGNNYLNIIPRSINNSSIVDAFIAVLLALTPILQHYKGIYENAGASVLILCFPWLVLKIVRKRQLDISDLLFILPIIIFDFYKAFDHGVSFGAIAHSILIMIIYLALANDCVDIHTLIKTSFIISEIATIIIIVQYICEYILGFHLQVVPISLLLPESEQWFDGLRTGWISITGTRNGFYRPSSIFMEPSHFFLYVFPQVALLLLAKGNNKWAVKRAVLLSIGVLLSTSGMGIAAVMAIWGTYLLFRSKYYDLLSIKQIFSIRSIVMIFLGLIVVTVAYFKVPFIHSSIDRIFIGDQFGNTAITGRTSRANELLSQISGGNLLIGVTKDISDISFNLSGFAATMYKYGLIGVFLSYIVYVRAVFTSKRQYRVIAIIVFFISFFSAHTHGTYHMLYFVVIIMAGYLEERHTENFRLIN